MFFYFNMVTCLNGCSSIPYVGESEVLRPEGDYLVLSRPFSKLGGSLDLSVEEALSRRVGSVDLHREILPANTHVEGFFIGQDEIGEPTLNRVVRYIHNISPFKPSKWLKQETLFEYRHIWLQYRKLLDTEGVIFDPGTSFSNFGFLGKALPLITGVYPNIFLGFETPTADRPVISCDCDWYLTIGEMSTLCGIPAKNLRGILDKFFLSQVNFCNRLIEG